MNLDATSGVARLPAVSEAIAAADALPAPAVATARHPAGQAAAASLDESARALVEWLGGEWDGVVFTGSAAEAHHLALNGRGEGVAVLPAGSRLSLVGAARAAASRVETLPLTPSGHLAPGDVAGLAEGDLLLLEAASGETGAVQPVAEISGRAAAAGARVMVDLSAAAGWAPLPDLAAACWVTLSFHRFGGPAGVGALLWRGDPPRPLCPGGTDQDGIRPGAPALGLAAGAAAAPAAFSAWLDGAAGWRRAWAGLRDALAGLPGLSPFSGGQRLQHVLAGAAAGVDLEAFRVRAALGGVAVGTGPACVSGAGRPSEALESMGVGDHRAGVLFAAGPGLDGDGARRAAAVVREAWVGARG